MADPKQFTPSEKPELSGADLEKYEKENAGLEVFEGLPRTEAPEEKSTDKLAAKRAQLDHKERTSPDQDKQEAENLRIEQRKDEIVAVIVDKVKKSGFDGPSMVEMEKKVDIYLKRGFADIAEAIHDRVAEEKARSGGAY